MIDDVDGGGRLLTATRGDEEGRGQKCRPRKVLCRKEALWNRTTSREVRTDVQRRRRVQQSISDENVEAPSIGIDVSASQFPQWPVPRHSPERVGGYKATNPWPERYP